MKKTLPTGTVADDDARLTYFAQALDARGIEMEPAAIQAFAEKKDRGETETQILGQASEGTAIFKSRLLMKRVFQGTALGVVVTPIADLIKGGRPAWREVVNRSPKTVGLGVLLGAGVGWAVGTLQSHAIAKAIECSWANFKRNTHEMEMAWTEAAMKRATKDPSAASNESEHAR
jgi:hypothetical protein